MLVLLRRVPLPVALWAQAGSEPAVPGDTAGSPRHRGAAPAQRIPADPGWGRSRCSPRWGQSPLPLWCHPSQGGDRPLQPSPTSSWLYWRRQFRSRWVLASQSATTAKSSLCFCGGEQSAPGSAELRPRQQQVLTAHGRSVSCGGELLPDLLPGALRHPGPPCAARCSGWALPSAHAVRRGPGCCPSAPPPPRPAKLLRAAAQPAPRSAPS